MGRKRRSAGKEGGSKDGKSVRFCQKMSEILHALSEMGGISTTVQGSSRVGVEKRQQLRVSLNKLALAMKASSTQWNNRSADALTGSSHLQNDNDSPTLAQSDWRDQVDSEEDTSWLTRLEEAACQVRSDCTDVLNVLETERAELLSLCRQLETVCQECFPAESIHNDWINPVQVTLFGRSLVAQYRRQLFMEEQIVDEVLSDLLSSLYDDEGSEFMSTRIQRNVDLIRQWIQCLEERILLDKLQWKHLPLVLDKLAKPTSLETFEIPLFDSGKTDLPSQQLNQTKNRDTRSTVKTHVLAANSVLEAVDVFIQQGPQSVYPSEPLTTLLLVVGTAGSGKTELCDEIQRKVSETNATTDCSLDTVQVIRPSLPLDVMGKSVGESEDMLISLFGYAKARHRKCIVLLDDVEHILGTGYAGPVGTTNSRNLVGGEPHTMTRLRSEFLSIVDSLRENGSQQQNMNMLGNQMLIICTARNGGDETASRFDKVFFLHPPNEKQRRHMISSCLGLDSLEIAGTLLSPQHEMNALLDDLVDNTLGRSYAEIAQYCRGAISDTIASEEVELNEENKICSQEKVLRAMKQSLRSLAPESLRSGSLDDFVDVNVQSARDLLASASSSNQPDPLKLPLFGRDAEAAWKQLEAMVVTPLCRAKALDELMYGGSNDSWAGRVVCSGVLLTGPPGCGKSAIARHCATIAASVLPSVTLLDVSCTSLVHKEVGGSERALQRLFVSARAAAPCILLMDGIENIAAVRGNDNTTEGTMDRLLSTLLTEVDGVDSHVDSHGSSSKHSGGIAIIGITHDPSWIDPALLRPGRLEKVIRLQYPDYHARRLIALREIERLPVQYDVAAEDPDLPSRPKSYNELSDFVAEHTQGMTAAEVIAVCTEACMISARKYFHIKDMPEQARLVIEFDDFVTALHLRGTG